MAKICNWGMFPKIEATQISSNNYQEIAETVRSASVIIARGNGRCYGDSSLQQTIFSTLALNKILSFDEDNGIIHCEAGVLLEDILDVIVPQGCFLPVTPGTKLITIGGAVASNVHGKNHHTEGAISNYIEALDVMTEHGVIMPCSRNTNSKLFTDTIGGMGLTGIILTVTLRLKKIETAYISQRAVKAKNINELLAHFEAYNDHTYSVAWVDCNAGGNSLGRSVLLLGEHTRLTGLGPKRAKVPLKKRKAKQINIPFAFPSFLMNIATVRLFNMLYYHKQWKRVKESIVHYDPYFYPLDAIRNWNRIYGKNGFVQYQFVIPFEHGKEGLSEILNTIRASGCAAFLAVLKTFGSKDAEASLLSFPEAGYTLAADFKISSRVFELLERLDTIVLSYDGRLYLTKDARMKKETFSKSYKRNFVHPAKFNSLQSQRLGI